MLIFLYLGYNKTFWMILVYDILSKLDSSQSSILIHPQENHSLQQISTT